MTSFLGLFLLLLSSGVRFVWRAGRVTASTLAFIPVVPVVLLWAATGDSDVTFAALGYRARRECCTGGADVTWGAEFAVAL